MTTLTDLISRVDDHVSQIEPRRALVAIITIPLFVAGVVIGFLIRILWLIGVYLWSAAVVGFDTGFGRKRGPEA